MQHLNDNTRTLQVIQLTRQQGIVRPRDMVINNIPRSYLQRLYNRGILVRSGRGAYLLAEASITESASLAEACNKIPQGMISLLSALRFHQVGTQTPFQVWVAIHPKAHLPKIDYPPVRIVRFSGNALSEGIEEHQTAEGLVRVYSVAKTVADCFRYRNKIGLDVALEALREAWREKRVTMDELWHYATILRISTVMRPYLEALV